MESREGHVPRGLRRPPGPKDRKLWYLGIFQASFWARAEPPLAMDLSWQNADSICPGELFSMIPDCWWVWGWQERANSIGFLHPVLLMSPMGAPAVNHTGSQPNLYLREKADEQRCWAAGLARRGWLKINNIAEDPVPPFTERMKILGQLGSLNNQTIFFPLNFQGLGTSLVAQWLKLCASNARGIGFDPWLGN